MPLYDYLCEECGGELEKLQKTSESPAPDCPECGTLMIKVPSTFAFKFKNPWVSQMENKWGKDGDPYRDEEGKPRPGTGQEVHPHIPGPKTIARRKEMKKELQTAVRRGDMPSMPDDFDPDKAIAPKEE